MIGGMALTDVERFCGEAWLVVRSSASACPACAQHMTQFDQRERVFLGLFDANVVRDTDAFSADWD